MNFWQESTLVTCILAWFIAQLIKVVTVIVTTKKIDFRRVVGSGGMPSSHSSFVTSLATAIGIDCGLASPEFAISVVLALIVMYDAAGVRRAAGQQAKILNQMIELWEKGDFSSNEKRLKELLGHTPLEVIMGAIFGIVFAYCYHNYFLN